ncbi:MAG: ornithine carbamoyltransferase [Candidatus Omnitrophica bacterium]|nr:ornithine carbamoyltransferase [Candidatus Omnitrophota bacterium]
MNHFIALKYFSQGEIEKLIDLAIKIKSNRSLYRDSLKGKSIGLIFEKPSLRTKTAFYIGAVQLGAEAIYYTPQEIKIGERESVGDIAGTFSVYLDAVVLRTFSHDTILEFAKLSKIPIVNALSDFFHPSQVLADILTIKEAKGDIKKLKIVYAGDGNNVCNSLIHAFSILGGNLTLSIPKGYGYGLKNKVLAEAKAQAEISGAKISFNPSLSEAAKGADVLYTDVWTSMGKESERKKRKKAFKNFQINDKILKAAKSDCIVMHCLPAHRGEEITDSVIDSKNSAVFKQAENRLHAAKAILVYLLKGNKADK